jgi:hypothetical protein
MMYTELETRTRLQGVLRGFPSNVVPSAVQEQLVRLCIDLDTIGRLHAETGEPMVDKHTLRALLWPVAGEDLASRLVTMLEALPEHHLRLAVFDAAPAEAGWYALADRIVIYDTEPESTYGQLHIAWRNATEDVVDAIYRAFPSLEKEMIDPAIVPPRIVELLQPDGGAQFFTKLVELDRQLGWWAALIAVLLVPIAIVSTTAAADAQRNAWPLGIFALAAGVGGWTLTVVESVLLAPLD